jgi:hypothetical protein
MRRFLARSSTSRLPTFVYIGPDKTGSTWMYEVLRRHPQVFVPRVKDIYFFDRYYSRGLDWYAGFFRHAAPEHIAVGELSHDYLFSAEAARRISCDLPHVRVFTSLRNPVERTFSHYLYLKRSGLTTASFDDAVQRIPALVDNSLYHAHLRPWFELFPDAHLRVFLFDDLVADAQAFAQSMLQYLGVDPRVPLSLPGQTLSAGEPRSVVLAALMKYGANLARDLRLTSMVGFIKTSFVQRLLYREYEGARRPQLTFTQRQRLWRYFEQDVAALEARLGRSFAHWRPAEPARPVETSASR